MSLPEFLILSLALWFGLACLGVAAWAWGASRLPDPPEPDPDATADDYDALPVHPLYLSGDELADAFYAVVDVERHWLMDGAE